MPVNDAPAADSPALARLMPGLQPVTLYKPAAVGKTEAPALVGDVGWRHHCIGVVAYAQATGDYSRVTLRHMLGAGFMPMAQQRARELPQAMG